MLSLQSTRERNWQAFGESGRYVCPNVAGGTPTHWMFTDAPADILKIFATTETQSYKQWIAVMLRS